MAKAWTGQEIKACSLIYSTQGVKPAMAHTGRSKPSVIEAMRSAGVKCFNSAGAIRPQPRKWWAEDIATMFELIECGLKYSIIAEYFNSTTGSITAAIHYAKKNGFDAYPLRNK